MSRSTANEINAYMYGLAPQVIKVSQERKSLLKKACSKAVVPSASRMLQLAP